VLCIFLDEINLPLIPYWRLQILTQKSPANLHDLLHKSLLSVVALLTGINSLPRASTVWPQRSHVVILTEREKSKPRDTKKASKIILQCNQKPRVNYKRETRNGDVADNAGLWLRHSRQMPRAYDVEGAYERWLQNMLNRR